MRTKSKIVKTKDLSGKENGWLMELSKDKHKTTSYLTVALPGCFKGYHLHTIRESNYVCVRGKIKIILYTKFGREEHILTVGDKLNIGINIPTGISNEWDEEAWLINFPDPAYDPNLIGEQIDFTEEECEKFK